MPAERRPSHRCFPAWENYYHLWFENPTVVKMVSAICIHCDAKIRPRILIKQHPAFLVPSPCVVTSRHSCSPLRHRIRPSATPPSSFSSALTNHHCFRVLFHIITDSSRVHRRRSNPWWALPPVPWTFQDGSMHLHVVYFLFLKYGFRVKGVQI
jgi:hypothetical protein